MDTIQQDLRYSLRSLLKSPIFTLISLLVLAIGIGANSAIFSVVNGVLLRPLAYQDPDGLVMVWGAEEGKGKDTVIPADFLDWRRLNRSFSALAGYSRRSFGLTGGDRPEQVEALSVTGNFFSTLGVKPLLGPGFQTDPASNERDAVVLSHSLWQQYLGEDPRIIGRKLLVDSKPHTVVGVMPAGFSFYEKADLWVRAPRDIPDLGLDIKEDPATARDLSYMRAVGRLKDGTSLERAQADMDGIARQLAEQFPKTHAKRSVLLVPLQKEVVGDVDKALIALLGAVSLVLLLACTNVANLFFARATDRQREITVRIALGASRERLLRQLLTESVLLAVTAGVLGLAFGWSLTRIMVSLSPGNIPRLDEIRLDGRVLAFTMGVSVVTGLLCGLLPLLQIRRVDLVAALKAGGVKATDSLVRQRLRSSLVVAEVALAVVLLLGAGLMIKSFANLRQVEPGFKPDRLLTFRIALPQNRYQKRPQQAAFVAQLLDRIKAQPGVVNASSVLTLPAGGESINIPFVIEGQPRPEGKAESRDGYQVVSAGYFETMGIPLLKGRTFNATDNETSVRVAVLSRAMARRYWGDKDPLGNRIAFGKKADANSKWYTVVGVVADVHHDGPSGELRAETYVPFAQWSWPYTAVAVRTSGEPLALLTPVRRLVQELDPDLPITAVHTMDELLSGSISRPRFTSFLLGLFASMALLLSAIGLYGVMAYAVTQRTPEIGIRMALGAQKGVVMRDVLRRGVLLTLTGIALGLTLALALSGLVKALLFGVAVTDRGTLVVVPLVLLCTALLATLVPAWKASRVDPLKAIRWE